MFPTPFRVPLKASANAAGETCTQSFGTLNRSGAIIGNGSQNVICVQNIALGGGATLTLSGSASDTFIINITGSISMGGGSRIVVAGGLSPANVLYNVKGAGANLVIGGASRVDGTILAISRNMDLSAGIVNGSVISGRDINIGSGEQVRCPRIPKK